MDSLFLMQRYWGSESDDEKEEDQNDFNHSQSDDSKVSNKKRKLDIPVVEIDNDHQDAFKKNDAKNNGILSSVIEIDSTNSSDSGEQHEDSPMSETEVLDVECSDLLDVIKEENSTQKEVENKKNKPKKKKLKQSKTKENDTLNLQVANHNEETFCTIGKIQNQKHVKMKHSLPLWLAHPTYISVDLSEEETPVFDLNYLDSNTKKNLKNAGINFLFPVQLAVIPWLMQSKDQSLIIRPSDICVSAPTGSGKTLAFVLPIVQSLKDRVVRAIRALVVLPVSELAIQVYKVFEVFVHGTDLKVALLTGQKSFIAEQNTLVRSSGDKIQNLVDIIVTTPGRVHDHMYRTKGFCLKRLRYLVIDEADRMMEEIQQGWLKQVENAIFHNCAFTDCICSSYERASFEPSSAFNFGFISQPLQKLLYSATLTHDPEQLHNLSLYKPKLFTASTPSLEQEYTGLCVIPSGINMLQAMCDEGVKPMVICHLIKHHNFKKVLCFTESVERAHRLHLVLEEMGLLQVREISSFNRAIQRKIVLEQFSCGKVDILVCSDLVARGIDIEDVDCVISYDVPQSVKIYIHRIGRTARAGKTGTAITLLSEGEIPHFKKMLKRTGIEMPQKIDINAEDLKPLVSSYKTALALADTKLKKEKLQLQGRAPKRTKI